MYLTEQQTVALRELMRAVEEPLHGRIEALKGALSKGLRDASSKEERIGVLEARIRVLEGERDAARVRQAAGVRDVPVAAPQARTMQEAAAKLSRQAELMLVPPLPPRQMRKQESNAVAWEKRKSSGFKDGRPSFALQTVVEVRKLAAHGVRQTMIAKMVGLSDQSVSRIIRNPEWADRARDQSECGDRFRAA